MASLRKTEVLRKIYNVHNKTEINLIVLSVYHNLIATAAFDNKVAIYDYEFGRLLAKIELEKSTFASGLNFIEGYSLLVVATESKHVYLVDISNKDYISV